MKPEYDTMMTMTKLISYFVYDKALDLLSCVHYMYGLTCKKIFYERITVRIIYHKLYIFYWQNKWILFIDFKNMEVTNFFNFILLLLSGDIESNPGPQFKFPCGNCEKPVKSNQCGLLCSTCKKWYHIHCQEISMEIYSILYMSPNEEWCCSTCFLPSFCESLFDPYANSTIENSEQENLVPENIPEPTLQPNYSKDQTALYQDFENIFDVKGLHFVHLNVRSILQKIPELRILFKRKNLAVIAFTETWLNDSVNNEEINIDGYKVIRNDRSSGHGGGVCLYIRNNLAFNVISEMQTEVTESLWINVLLPRSKPIVLGVLYRPPKNNKFIEHLSNSLENFSKDEEIIILGDMNICLLHNSSFSKKYIDLLNLNGLRQLIDEPTRVTSTCSSLLDHVICSKENKISKCGIIDLGISDHSFTFCTRKMTKFAVSQHKTTTLRSLKKYSDEAFISQLSLIDWSSITNCSDVNEAWSKFQDIFISKLNALAPLKEVRIKQRTEVWMNKDILSLIRERNSAYKKMKKNMKDEKLSKLYRKLRNLVQREVKKAKLEHLQNQIEENKKDSRKLWQNLKNLGLKNKKGGDQEIVINIDGKLCHDKKAIANEFNNYFTNVAANLVNKLPPSNNIFNVFYNDNVRKFYSEKGLIEDSFELLPVGEQFVYNELQKLNVSKGTGLDLIPAKFLKDGAIILFKPLCFMINLSIMTSTFPDDLKIAKVTPLHKKKDKTDVGNYRPISVLGVVSKIFEKSVLVQIERYYKDNNIIYDFQSGFRHDYSTETSLIHITDYVRTQISHGQFVGMVLLDLQKAFDTVNHEILLKKLQVLGFNKANLEWFRSYLSNRHQLVSIRNVHSELLPIKCGVPQGSILGPILFTSYINDMCICLHDCKLLLYADDSVLLYSSSNPKSVEKK